MLAVIHAAFAPFHRDGTTLRSIQAVHSASQVEGARIAYLRPKHVEMPDPAREIITGYVANPEYVANMVTRGHMLAKWLETGDSTG